MLHRHCGYSKAFQDSDEEKMHYQNGQGECWGSGICGQRGGHSGNQCSSEGGKEKDAHRKDQSPRNRDSELQR